MKRCFVLFFVFLLFGQAAAAEGFKEKRSTHFIVLYQDAPDDFVEKVINGAESYYDRITEELGFRRFDFWLWENRAKIYIYNDSSSYQAASGQPRWSAGAVLPKRKIIQTFVCAGDFLETTLPHELGHIIFREFVGFNNPGVPLWLEEGVASYQEKERYSQAKVFLRRAIGEGNFMDLKKLSGLPAEAGLNPGNVDIFYAESFSIVDFLIRDFGRDKFVLFCQNLRDYKDLIKALRLSYSFASLEELNSAWVKYLNR